MSQEEFLKTQDIAEGEQVVLLQDLGGGPLTGEEKNYRGSFPPKGSEDMEPQQQVKVEKSAKAKPAKKKKIVTVKTRHPGTYKK